jgi:hypothetical protein
MFEKLLDWLTGTRLPKEPSSFELKSASLYFTIVTDDEDISDERLIEKIKKEKPWVGRLPIIRVEVIDADSYDEHKDIYTINVELGK